MHCPYCNASETKVMDSSLAAEGAQVRRRRLCSSCQERFTTFEMVEVVMPRIIKSSGTIEPYDNEKLRRSILLPLQKRPITSDEQEAMISRVEKRVRQRGEREVNSKVLGEIIMSELKALDDVAYVRFASVYRDFKILMLFIRSLPTFALLTRANSLQLITVFNNCSRANIK